MAAHAVKIRWTADAAGDLKSTHEYLSEGSLKGADALV
jgi:hypothetical protein